MLLEEKLFLGVHIVVEEIYILARIIQSNSHDLSYKRQRMADLTEMALRI